MAIFNEIYNRTFADGNAIISAYVKSGMDINARNYDGKSVLFAAASMGLTAGVKQLIDAKADVNAKANDGYTALVVAIGNGYVDIPKLLIKANADVNMNDNKWGVTALMSAAEKGNKELVHLILKAKADLSIKDKEGQTALDYATKTGDKGIIAMLSKPHAGTVSRQSNDLPTKPWWKFW